MEKQKDKHTMERLSEQFNKYRNGYYFPSDDIDPKEKKGEWCLAWQEAIWAMFVNNQCYTPSNGYAYLQLLRLYGAGKQPNNIYMDWTIGDEATNPLRQGYMSTNWRVFSPMSKFKRLIRGRFEQQDYMATANAVDPVSKARKEDQKWDVWVESEYGQQQAEIMEIVTGIKDDSQKVRYVAKSLEELDMFNEMGGIKLRTEAEIETALDATDYLSDIKKVKQKVLDDFVDFGKAAFRDYYDPITGTVKKEYVDWEKLIIDYSNETDFNDIRFWSYLKFETVNNVRVRSGLTEDELMKIARLNCGMWGNMSSTMFNSYRGFNYQNDKGVRIYDQFRVPILISEWISTDSEYKMLKKKKGEEMYYPQEHGKVYNTDNKKTKVNQVNNVYNSTWIIGSKHVYEDGLSLNIARPNPKEPKLSIHAQVLPGQSITESIIPNLDQLCLTWFKWQSAMAQASPNGIDWDLTQLEGINLGGGTLTSIQLIQLKRQTGDSFRRTINLQSGKQNNMGKASNRNEGGIGEFLNEIVSTMDMQFKYIADLTGIDIISGAGEKPGEVTATEVKHAGAATNDALQPIFTSWVQMQEHAGQTVACKIQRAIKYHPEAKAAYEGILGTIGAKVLSIGADTTAAQFGIKIELKSNEAMVTFAMQQVLESIKIAANGGPGISGADGYYFVDMIQRGRVKHAMALFNYKVNKSKMDAQKLQAQNMEQNRETLLAGQKQKDAGKAQEIMLQAEADMKTEAVKALLQINVENNAHLNELKQMYIEQILTPPEPAQPAVAA